MKHLAGGLFLGGVTLILMPLATLGGCSDDEGNDVVPKDPTAVAGSAGQAGNGSGGAGGSTGGSGGGGAGGSAGEPPDAGMQDTCTPVFLDAGVVSDAGTDAGGDAGAVASNGPVSFAADIYPIMRADCVPCHATQFAGGHNVASPDQAEAYGFALELKERIYERVNGGGMPQTCNGVPGDPGCLSVAEADLILRWSAQCFPP